MKGKYLIMAIKHYYDFGTRIHKKLGNQQLNASGWDLLRTTSHDKEFMIEPTREKWLYTCKKKREYHLPAKAIVKYCVNCEKKPSKVVSMGIGKGILEWYIKKEIDRKKENIKMTCFDNTPGAIEKLKNVFWECDELGVFDMIDGDWQVIESQSLVVLYRLSTEFSKMQWCQIFRKIHKAGVETVIFVPTDVLRINDYLLDFKRKKSRFMNRNCDLNDVFCGWRYSENEFRRMWKPYYKEIHSEKAGEMRIYYLEIAH